MTYRMEFNVEGTLEDGRKYVDPNMWFTWAHLPKVLRWLKENREGYPEARLTLITRWSFGNAKQRT